METKKITYKFDIEKIERKCTDWKECNQLQIWSFLNLGCFQLDGKLVIECVGKLFKYDGIYETVLSLSTDEYC